MPKPNEPRMLGKLSDHPDLAEELKNLEAELERRRPGSVKKLSDGTKLVTRYGGLDLDLDEGFARVYRELARRSGLERPAPVVRVKEGDHVTIDGYRLRVGKVLENGVVYLELRDEDGRFAASCPADGERLVPEAP
ncbi:MAG TPA: hypothetical protein DFS52_19485, partial [Myxococcales bacterium]|nr:hypothetical protein [Myxococcales bacterium]